MNPQFVIHIVAQALTAAFWICLPLLALCFSVSVLVNILQIATSMQDSVFSTVPRLTVALAGIILLMPWMLHRAAAYAISIFGDLAQYAH